jgi:kumamolisin
VLGTAVANARVEFQVALQMRNKADLQARIHSGQRVPFEEMGALYYPLAKDHSAMVQWLKGQGFTIDQTYGNHLTIEVSGTVAQVRKAFSVDMVRVKVDGVEHIAARTAPTLPDNLAKFTVGINGLQPYQKAFPLNRFQPLTNNAPPYKVSEILKAYNADTLTQKGAGQTSAIIIDTFAVDSDLTSFWSANGIPQSLSNITKVKVVSRVPSTTSGEETLDTEWTSGIASAAKIRVYGTGSLSTTKIDKGFQKIISDLPSFPSLNQLNISLGLCEQDYPTSNLQTDSNLLASIAAGGVSVLVSSGDSGSNNRCTSGLGVSYYASDTHVTAVGGTNLKISTSTGAVTSETAWTCTGTCSSGGSGGGISSFFSRPTWQTNTGISGTTRLVPDVAAVGDPATGVLVVWKGKNYQFGGTSVAAPVWAGFTALINQARDNAGKASLGLLGPYVYPLAGTSNFRDITSGGNGAYSAIAGYDLVTGIGVPVMSTLLPTLVSQP